MCNGYIKWSLFFMKKKTAMLNKNKDLSSLNGSLDKCHSMSMFFEIFLYGVTIIIYKYFFM